MKTFILIMYTASRGLICTQEYNSLENCEKAGIMAQNSFMGGSKVQYVCTEK